MKNFCKLLSAAIIAVLLISEYSSMEVLATGNLGQGAKAEEVTALTVTLDTKGLDFTEDVQLNITNNDSKEDYPIVLSSATGYKAQRAVRRDTVYDVIIAYKNTDGFDIVSRDDEKPITSCTTATSSLEIELVLKEAAVRNADGAVSAEGKIMRQKLQTEGAALLKTYYEKASFMEENEDANSFLNRLYGEKGGAMKGHYFDNNENATEEKWSAMTPLQRYSQMELYTMPKINLMGVSPKSEESKFLDSFELSNKGQLTGYDMEKGTKMFAAMTEIWKWQWDCWHTKGLFIDLFSDEPVETAITNTAVVAVTEVAATEESVQNETTIAVIEKVNTHTPVTPVEKIEKKPTAVILVVIAVVVVGALLIAGYINKRKNINKSDGK